MLPQQQISLILHIYWLHSAILKTSVDRFPPPPLSTLLYHLLLPHSLYRRSLLYLSLFPTSAPTALFHKQIQADGAVVSKSGKKLLISTCKTSSILIVCCFLITWMDPEHTANNLFILSFSIKTSWH